MGAVEDDEAECWDGAGAAGWEEGGEGEGEAGGAGAYHEGCFGEDEVRDGGVVHVQRVQRCRSA